MFVSILFIIIFSFRLRIANHFLEYKHFIILFFLKSGKSWLRRFIVVNPFKFQTFSSKIYQ